MHETRHPLQIRYVECDPMGIAHHSAYPVWFEMGRTEAIRAGGLSYRDLEAAGASFAVTRLEIRFLHPLRYDDEVEVVTRLQRMTRVKAEHTYEIRRSGLVTTTAATTVACVGADGRPQAVPEELARALGGRSD